MAVLSTTTRVKVCQSLPYINYIFISAYFIHTLTHTLLSVTLNYGLFVFSTLFIHSFLHSLTHPSKFILSFILMFKYGYASLLAEIVVRYYHQICSLAFTFNSISCVWRLHLLPHLPGVSRLNTGMIPSIHTQMARQVPTTMEQILSTEHTLSWTNMPAVHTGARSFKWAYFICLNTWTIPFPHIFRFTIWNMEF